MGIKPTLDGFREWLEENEDVELSQYQIELADSLIGYRNKVFCGGLRSGRTFVIDLVTKYYQDEYSFVLLHK
jgi:hypothetical protein